MVSNGRRWVMLIVGVMLQRRCYITLNRGISSEICHGLGRHIKMRDDDAALNLHELGAKIKNCFIK